MNRHDRKILNGEVIRVSRLFPASKSTPQITDVQASVSRRTVLTGLGILGLGSAAGCSSTMDMPALQLDTTTTGAIRPQISVDRNITDNATMYASLNDNGFVVPEIPYDKIKPEFRRQIVVDPTGEAPGTIVVSLSERHLYWVQEGGEAIRYGVGIGKAGFEWNGRAVIQYTKQWPTWTPPKEMIARKPELVKWVAGQPGGLDNPLGARAHYIYKDDLDTGYRVHGSPEWWTIGTQASSGCVRMINQDVIDLYNRVKASPTKVPIVVA
ncbi:Lipoprotein-anchoring transpeptidase ErfK/SrfK [Mesorhizobium albiziae]|uniref:Lipoprotein-anchoring transpeptidase ErfK/SrfK n=1 Tax=Neomesorhizobium albiziae TaxID=335020 RepID=A0A1I3ZYI1_9HYPH|nr:L,D-transpeptidase [Mesorhizobium albiziae]SFK49128.1 Lipoprotein-anchoring transpeptidase ErfK/SrfK [Mesorhizobium albiziae]